MALQNRDQNLKYLRVKDGKFYVGKDLETPYSELEGVIVGIRYKDEEYEGQPQRKFIMVIEDGDEKYQIGLNVESSTYSSVVSFLANVDVSRKLTLHPKQDTTVKDGKETTRRSMLISQDGKFAKSFFTKDERHGLPEWNVVKVGNKKVVDKTDYLSFLEKFVETTITSKLSESTAPEPAQNVAAKPQSKAPVANPVDEEDEISSTDDLPWND